MDSTAISLAKESKIPILITNINKKNSIINAINGIGKFSKILENLVKYWKMCVGVCVCVCV